MENDCPATEPAGTVDMEGDDHHGPVVLDPQTLRLHRGREIPWGRRIDREDPAKHLLCGGAAIPAFREIRGVNNDGDAVVERGLKAAPVPAVQGIKEGGKGRACLHRVIAVRG
jgi:hypothetical protein